MNAPFPQPRLEMSNKMERYISERPVHDARELTAGGAEARIVLDGVPYVLRITRLGKLILTK
jgi:hemin uptake protein HemP